MAVTIKTPVRVGPNSWRVGWSSDQPNPIFRLFRNGAKLRDTLLTAEVFTMGENEVAVLEVRDDALASTYAADPRALLNWGKPVAATKQYRVEQSVSAAWVPKATLGEDGPEYKNWKSQPLPDGTTQTFRVTAIGVNNNESTPVSAPVKIVRHPDPPAVTFAYDDGTNQVTIAVAA